MLLPFSTARRLARSHSIADLRRLAKRRLPRAVFDYADGAAEDEVTARRNEAAFEDYELLPRVLRDVSSVDLSTTVLGTPVSMPVLLAPTGMTRLFHHDGETAAARAAHRAGVVYTLSSLSTVSIEDLAKASDGPRWFQIYVWKDRGLVREFFDRCRAAGYDALMLTVDVPVLGQRERDLRNGMTIPPSLTLGSALDAALHPSWWWNFLTKPRIGFANVAGKGDAGRDNLTALWTYINTQFDPSVTWRDLEWMIGEWNGSFAVKGVLDPEDAARAASLGARGIVVSNHGGRQLDHSPASLDALPAVVEAVAGRAEVILDGGVRRGADVAKALALGARACAIGRAYLYGIGAGGEQGVDRALELLRAELHRALALLGCASVTALGPEHVRRRGRRGQRLGIAMTSSNDEYQVRQVRHVILRHRLEG